MQREKETEIDRISEEKHMISQEMCEKKALLEEANSKVQHLERTLAAAKGDREEAESNWKKDKEEQVDEIKEWKKILHDTKAENSKTREQRDEKIIECQKLSGEMRIKQQDYVSLQAEL